MDRLVRIALSAVQVVDPNDCALWYERGNGVTLCENDVTAGSRRAQPRTIEHSGDKAVVTVGEPGGNPVALQGRRYGGGSRVYDSPNLLPAAD